VKITGREKMKKIKLTVITRNEGYLQRLAGRLREEKDISLLSSIVINHFKSEMKQSIAFLEQTFVTQPDVLLLDQTILRDAAAIDVQQVLAYRDKLMATKFIIVGERYNEESVMAEIEAGVRGFFRTVLGDEMLIKCIHAVAQGEIWLDAALIARVFEEFIKEAIRRRDHLKPLAHLNFEKLKMLSPREMEILALISESMTNEEIADKLFLSTKTVKTHVRNIFEKAGIRNRVEAAVIYARHVQMSD
jgi:DNA-binding NarL/FixJ family response regulator